MITLPTPRSWHGLTIEVTHVKHHFEMSYPYSFPGILPTQIEWNQCIVIFADHTGRQWAFRVEDVKA